MIYTLYYEVQGRNIVRWPLPFGSKGWGLSLFAARRTGRRIGGGNPLFESAVYDAL